MFSVVNDFGAFGDRDPVFESSEDLLSGKPQDKCHGDPHQRGSEHEPSGEGNPDDRHHHETQRDEYAGDFGVDLHRAKWARMTRWVGKLHAFIVALISEKGQRLRKLEVDRDAGLEVRGLVVMPVRFVTPLLHCGCSRLREDRVAGN